MSRKTWQSPKGDSKLDSKLSATMQTSNPYYAEPPRIYQLKSSSAGGQLSSGWQGPYKQGKRLKELHKV